MRKLIIVRHGDYDNDGTLNHAGKKQMEKISFDLHLLLEEGHGLILSSPAPRAIQSAEILSENLGILVEPDERLWSDNKHPYDVDRAFAYINEKQEQNTGSIIIVVTHLEYCDLLPGFIYKNFTGKQQRFSSLQKGEKLVIDFTRG